LLVDVRHFREQERLRFWPGVWRRWVLAVAFALASAAAAGASYSWWRDPLSASALTCGTGQNLPMPSWRERRSWLRPSGGS
jgi:hypothetical protein